MKRFSFLIAALLISLSSLAQTSGRAKSEGSPYDKKTQAKINHFNDIIKKLSKSINDIQLPSVTEQGGCSSPNKSQSEYDYNRTIQSLNLQVTRLEKIIEDYSSSPYDYLCKQLQHNQSLLAVTMGTEKPKSYECNELSIILKNAKNNIDIFNKCLENVSNNQKINNDNSTKIDQNNKKTYANKEFNKLVESESKKADDYIRQQKIMYNNQKKTENARIAREKYLRDYGTPQQRQQENLNNLGQSLNNLGQILAQNAARKRARRVADAKKRALLQKKTNLRLKEGLVSHNMDMQNCIDILKSKKHSLTNMLNSIKENNLKKVYVVLANYKVTTKKPYGASINLPYKHLNISYLEKQVSLPITDFFATKYKKHIDKFNLFYVEDINKGEQLNRKSYYFNSEKEAKNFLQTIEKLIRSRSDYVDWTTITSENYNPVNFTSHVGKFYQEENPYMETNTDKQYAVYDSKTNTNNIDIINNRNVIDRYMKVVGGREKLKSIKTVFIKSILVAQGMTLELEIKSMKPGNYSQIVFVNGTEAMKEVTNGQRGYQVRAGNKSPLTSEKAISLSKNAKTLIPEPISDNYDSKPKKRTIENGVKTYMIRNKKDKLYFDIKSGLLLKMKSYIDDYQLDNKATIIYFSDYRNVDGIRIPFKTKTTYQGISVSIEHKIMKLNESVSKSDFSM